MKESCQHAGTGCKGRPASNSSHDLLHPTSARLRTRNIKRRIVIADYSNLTIAEASTLTGDGTLPLRTKAGGLTDQAVYRVIKAR
jgi:hypothetical protein